MQLREILGITGKDGKYRFERQARTEVFLMVGDIIGNLVGWGEGLGLALCWQALVVESITLL